jgi:hypothetical protein
MTPGAILRDALAALRLLRMRSVVDALLKRRDDVGKVFLDHLVDAERSAPGGQVKPGALRRREPIET